MRSLGVLLAEGLDVVVVDLPAGRGSRHAGAAQGGAEAWDARRARGRAIRSSSSSATCCARARARGDPRERALQAVVRAASPGSRIRSGSRSARAREPGVRARRGGARARRATLSGRAQRAEPALAAAVRERVDAARAHVERELLQALLAAPEALDASRGERSSPEDFRDPDRARRWRGGCGRASDARADGRARRALARELRARARRSVRTGRAKAHGAARRCSVRRARAAQAGDRRAIEPARDGAPADGRDRATARGIDTDDPDSRARTQQSNA